MAALLLAQDFPPMGGGIARLLGELARRYPRGELIVSTPQNPDANEVDAEFGGAVDRLPMSRRFTKTLPGLLLWSRRATGLARQHRVRFVYCGNMKPAGYPARWVYERTHVPYGVFLYGADLLSEQHKYHSSKFKRRSARAILGGAARDRRAGAGRALRGGGGRARARVAREARPQAGRGGPRALSRPGERARPARALQPGDGVRRRLAARGADRRGGLRHRAGRGVGVRGAGRRGKRGRRAGRGARRGDGLPRAAGGAGGGGRGGVPAARRPRAGAAPRRRGPPRGRDLLQLGSRRPRRPRHRI